MRGLTVVSLISKNLLFSAVSIARSNVKCFSSRTIPKQIFNMNEAILHYKPGDDVFNISFRYVQSTWNIDRHFNFCRQVNETVENFLKRICTNINKTLNEKYRKKRLKNPDLIVNDIQVDNVALYKDESKIDNNLSCAEILEDTSNLKLMILETIYVIKQNVPSVINLTLSSSILAGFPTYPCKFEALYTDVQKSVFNWYKASNPGKNSKWEMIGSGYVYIPRTSDIGYTLKVTCIPKNEVQTGPLSEVQSKNVVEAGPGHCPFDTRHSFTRNKLEGQSFRVVSYNILADTYTATDYSKEHLFSYCPEHALDMDYRKYLILKELIGYNADAICLQEVDSGIFKKDLMPTLISLDYNGMYNTKNESSEGLAMFFRQDRFEQLDSDCVIIGKNFELMEFQSVWSKIQNEKMKKRFLERNTIVQVMALHSKENPSEILVYGNTHLYFHPDAAHIRLLQAYYTLLYLQSFITRIKKKHTENNISVILCGDFNSVPERGIYQLMTENYVPENCEDWNSVPEEAVEDISLTHDFQLSSACGTPEYTNYTPSFAACLDYIFYEKNRLNVEQVVPFPSKEEVALHGGLPSVILPSDHLSLCVDFKWTTNGLTI